MKLKLNKKTLCTIVACLTINFFFSFSQDRTKIDSLKNALQTVKHDTVRIKLLSELGNQLYGSDIDTALHFYQQALLIIEKNEKKINATDVKPYQKTKINILYYIASVYFERGDFEKVLDYCKAGLELAQKLDDNNGMLIGFGNLAQLYRDIGQIKKSIEYYFKSLEMSEKIGYKEGIAYNLTGIGVTYLDQGEPQKALKYMFKSLKLDKEIGNKAELAIVHSNIGVIYNELGETEKAFKYLKKSLKINEDIANIFGIIYTLNQLGAMYSKTGDTQKAKTYLINSLKKSEKTGLKKYLASTLYYMGTIYYKEGKLDSAILYLSRSMDIGQDMGTPKIIKKASSFLHIIYAEQQKYKAAYEAHMVFKKMTDSINNSEASQLLINHEMQAKFEKKEALMDAEAEKERAMAEEVRKRQNIIIAAVSGGLLMLLVFVLFLYNRFRVTRKQKNIIQEQKALVDEKNKNITDSIRYAKEIQEAILPTDEEIAELLPESFVLFKPKDIVSGDFYWATQTKNNKVIWAAADCTGHGVPGAFMSMIGNALLNEIVIEKSITEPAQILNELKTYIIDSLSQTGESGEHRDGMDIALCTLEKETNKLEFAGAYNPLFLVRKGIANSEIGKNGKLKIFDEDLGELKADRQPIGYEQDKDQPFTNHEIQLKKGDTLYTFSDGYADQYGGDENSLYGEGKKFSRGRFKKLVSSLQEQSMTEQKEAFDTTIESYKGDLEQVDDILVIGVRI